MIMSNVPQFSPQRNGDSESWSNSPQIVRTPGLPAPSSALCLHLLLKQWGKESRSGEIASASPSPPHPFFFQGRTFPKEMPQGAGIFNHFFKKKLRCFTILPENVSLSCKHSQIKKLPPSPTLFPSLCHRSVLILSFPSSSSSFSHYHHHHHLHLVPHPV